MHTPKTAKNRTDKQLRADPQIQKDYGDVLSLYLHHPVTMRDGVLRWEAGKLAVWIADRIDLNELAVAYQSGRYGISLKEYTKFYREMGYSLSGFIEIFGHELNLYGEVKE